MEKFVKGDIIVIPFPFSDLSNTKKRPAVVISVLDGNDLILCQITSSRKDDYSIKLDNKDFLEGSLDIESNIRPNKLFTADKSLILYKIGMLKENKITEIIQKIEQIIRKK